MATPGIWVSTSVIAVLSPDGRFAMSRAVTEYWLAPLGEIPGPDGTAGLRWPSTVTCARVVGSGPAGVTVSSTRLFWPAAAVTRARAVTQESPCATSV